MLFSYVPISLAGGRRESKRFPKAADGTLGIGERRLSGGLPGKAASGTTAGHEVGMAAVKVAAGPVSE